jgi:hypothetical protein
LSEYNFLNKTGNKDKKATPDNDKSVLKLIIFLVSSVISAIETPILVAIKVAGDIPINVAQKKIEKGISTIGELIFINQFGSIGDILRNNMKYFKSLLCLFILFNNVYTSFFNKLILSGKYFKINPLPKKLLSPNEQDAPILL